VVNGDPARQQPGPGCLERDGGRQRE
jgi:hypothetical protein